MTASRNHAGAAQPRRRLRAGGAGESSLAPSPPENGKAEADSGPPVMATPDIASWAENAAAGDMLVYATRPWLPVASPAAAFLRRLAEQGVVTLTQKRRHDLAGWFDYRATRTARAFCERPPRRAQTSPKSAALSAEVAAINALLPVLNRYARFNRPCPTDAQLGFLTGMPRDRIAPTIAALKRENMIRVLAAKAPTLRIVVMVESGYRTGIVA